MDMNDPRVAHLTDEQKRALLNAAQRLKDAEAAKGDRLFTKEHADAQYAYMRLLYDLSR